jgi:hypothetical protein
MHEEKYEPIVCIHTYKYIYIYLYIFTIRDFCPETMQKTLVCSHIWNVEKHWVVMNFQIMTAYDICLSMYSAEIITDFQVVYNGLYGYNTV